MTVEAAGRCTVQHHIQHLEILTGHVVVDQRAGVLKIIDVVQHHLIASGPHAGSKRVVVGQRKNSADEQDALGQIHILIGQILRGALMLAVCLDDGIRVIIAVELNGFVDAVIDLVVIQVDLNDWGSKITEAIVRKKLT